jgi:hypothetical protein
MSAPPALLLLYLVIVKSSYVCYLQDRPWNSADVNTQVPCIYCTCDTMSGLAAIGCCRWYCSQRDWRPLRWEYCRGRLRMTQAKRRLMKSAREAVS